MEPRYLSVSTISNVAAVAGELRLKRDRVFLDVSVLPISQLLNTGAKFSFTIFTVFWPTLVNFSAKYCFLARPRR